MKKNVCVVFSLVVALSFSCKKEHTCVCTNIPYIVEKPYTLEKSSKKIAKKACDDIEASYGSYKGAVTCKIK